MVLEEQTLRVLDLEGNDWYAGKDQTKGGKRSVKQSSNGRVAYRCNSKMDPVDCYSDENLRVFNSRQEQLQWLSETPGCVQATRLASRKYEAIDREEAVMIPKSSKLNVTSRSQLLEQVTKERFAENATIDPETGEIVAQSGVTTARRRQQIIRGQFNA